MNKLPPFNRTAYGIEICSSSSKNTSAFSFNRTAYGIEIGNRGVAAGLNNPFNRTAYGIEMGESEMLHVFPVPLLIAPLMELKFNLSCSIQSRIRHF